MNTSKNRNFPYWQCDPFYLNELRDDACKPYTGKDFKTDRKYVF